MKDQLGIVFGFFARMHPAHASIHAIEAKIQARRSTSIVITRLRQKASHRMCYAREPQALPYTAVLRITQWRNAPQHSRAFNVHQTAWFTPVYDVAHR